MDGYTQVIIAMDIILLIACSFVAGYGYHAWLHTNYIVEYRIWHYRNNVWSTWRPYMATLCETRKEAERMVNRLNDMNTRVPMEFQFRKQ